VRLDSWLGGAAFAVPDEPRSALILVHGMRSTVDQGVGMTVGRLTDGRITMAYEFMNQAVVSLGSELRLVAG
jgi:hypothetical protein